MKHIKAMFLMTLLSITSAQATEKPWYLYAIEHTELSYKNKCRLIKATQAFTKATTITTALLSKDDLTEIVAEIAQKKSAIKNAYLLQEQKILSSLCQSLNFTEDQWADCLKTITYIQQLTPSKTDVIHDPATPRELYSLLTTLLDANGIDIDTITIEYRPKKPQNPETLATTINRVKYGYCQHSKNIIQEPELMQTIILYEHIMNKPLSDQLANLAHEVQHIVKKEGITLCIIEKYLMHYYQKDRTYLEQNKDFQQLKVMYEGQAEVFAALKDPHVAQALIDLRAKQFYPGHLYEAHFNDLVEINNLWRIERFIKTLRHSTKLCCTRTNICK